MFGKPRVPTPSRVLDFPEIVEQTGHRAWERIAKSTCEESWVVLRTALDNSPYPNRGLKDTGDLSMALFHALWLMRDDPKSTWVFEALYKKRRLNDIVADYAASINSPYVRALRNNTAPTFASLMITLKMLKEAPERAAR